MRFLKTVHGWLGALVLPWIIIIGFTGLFLNHESLFIDVLAPEAYDEAQFDSWPGAKPMTQDEARALAERLYPGETLTLDRDTTYRGREVAIFAADRTEVIVALKTGHYWVKTEFTRTTYAPDGTVLQRKVSWGTLFKRLHVRGWPTRSLGTWLADITAASMIVFGLSGIVLFLVPRFRRRQNRKRMRAAATR